ncbi:MAG: HEAT repeat domain-containing protein, partial [Pyrinomonadaceae bacterium]
MKEIIFTFLLAIVCFSPAIFAQIPVKTLVQISRAEDELRFDKTLEDLMKNADPEIRRRAALAAGRIGNETAIPALTNLLENDTDESVRVTAAFALGEIESIKGADAILKVLNNLKNNPSIRARAVEAAGKIAAANAKDEKSKALGEAILQNLTFENEKRSAPFENVIELGLTAVLRARPAEAEQTLVKFIEAYTPQIRANALNTLTRLRAKNANKRARELLQKEADAIVRANAARVLGAAEDKDAFDLLLNVAVTDKDSRVRVSAIRALGSLKDGRAADKLLERGEKLLADYKKSKFANPVEKNELLEIATALGNLLKNTDNEKAIKFLDDFRQAENYKSPEIEIALARISPVFYAGKTNLDQNNAEWRSFSSIAQAFSEFADLDSDKFKAEREKTQDQLKNVIGNYPQFLMDSGLGMATPDILRAYAKFKSDDLSEFLRDKIKNNNPITRNQNERIFIRATAAELLGEQSATKENVEALKTAFAESLKTDKD